MASEPRVRVTVIDDHADLLALVAEVLVERGYEVTPIQGAPSGIGEIVATRPGLLIVELRLETRPGELGGWEIIQLVRAHQALRDVPIIICSADVRQLKRREAEIAALPHVDVPAKPFGVDELESAVRAMTLGNGNGGSAKAS